jgi:phenylpyruvate tautomerase PptA (4-oxalocrotonate tautomerase family)
MPTLTITVTRDDDSEETRAQIAELATAAVRDALDVDADKIQIFFRVGPTSLMRVKVVADGPDAEQVIPTLREALRETGFADVQVESFPPTYTAKGGVLRQPKGAGK